jgi:alkanesulfonate monooxygenase SsuD/methylene tetrahydromethanopterin reductase-like flavin-dependent oxidoreductase (luciferase family)
MNSMQLSTVIPTFSAEAPPSWEHLTVWAQLLEDGGFDRALVADHIAFGMNMDAYANPGLGGTAGGRQPTGPDGHWLEPLTGVNAPRTICYRCHDVHRWQAHA